MKKHNGLTREELNEKKKVSYSLTMGALILLEALAQNHGINEESTLEVVIREKAREEGLDRLIVPVAEYHGEYGGP